MSDPHATVRSVELAYPLEHEGVRHEPDAVVELPAHKAKQLVTDGRARWPGSPPPAAPAPVAASTQDQAAGSPAQGGVTGG